MDKSRYIDDKALPFTEDELYRALALTEDEQVARNAAHTMADLLSSGTYEGGVVHRRRGIRGACPAVW